MSRKIKIFLLSLFAVFLLSASAFASSTNGTIQTPNQYAWGDKAGWVNFAPDNGNVNITDSTITGYAWDSIFGWINLSPDSSGVKNDGAGNLSGLAWSAGAGWIDFSSVKINSSGKFTGTATGTMYGNINFDCSTCNVSTDWRPISSRDTTPPVTTANPASGTYGASRDVVLSCSDASGCAHTYYTTDNSTPTTGSATYSTPINIPANATLKYFSVDTVGNTESVNTETYVIDTNYPVTTITSGPDANTNSTSATFVFSANKSGSTYQCKLDSGSYASCTSPKNYTSLTDGNHTFYVKATDTLGHEEPTPASYSFSVNTTLPETSINSSPASLINSSSASFSFSADESATFQCKLDSGSYASCTSPKNYTGLADGNHTFYVKATDLANNEEPAPVSYNFTVDTQAPVTTASPASGTYGATRNIMLSCSDNLSGCNNTYYTTNGDTPTTGSTIYSDSSPIVISANTTLKYFSTDLAGNSESVKTETYVIDSTYPVTDITATPALSTNSTSATFVFSANKSGSTYQCKLDNGSYSSCTSPKNYTGLSEAEHTFYVKATDTLNHEEPTPVSFTWDVVSSAPVITISSPTITDTSATIIWTTNEIASSKVDFGLTNSYGNSTTEINTSPRVINHSINISNLTACATYHYSVHSIDSAANEGISADNTFTTTGCTGDSDINSQTQSTITTASGGSLNLLDNGQGITLTVPTSFSTINANFQIKQLNQDIVVEDTSVPANYQIIGSSVYDLKALSDISTKISTFTQPLTITLTYTTADIVGINESSLKIYRWDGSGWNQLNNCSTNTTNKTVTCTTNNFSVFGLFGQAQTSSSSGSSAPLGYANQPTIPTGGFKVSINNNENITASQNVMLSLTAGSNTTRMAVSNTPDFKNAGQEVYIKTKPWNLCQGLTTCNPGIHTVYVKYYTQYGVSSVVASDEINYQISKPGTVTNPTTPTTPTKPTTNITLFTKTLKLGQISLDVKKLQILLNSDLTTLIAKTGPGSKGKETNFFGSATKQAVIKFQEKYAKDILTPNGLKKGTGIVGLSTIKKLNELLKK